MARVLVTRRPLGGVTERLSASHHVSVWPEDRAMPRVDLLGAVAGVEGLYCFLTDRIDSELLERAPSLKAISQMAVGVDNVDLEAATARKIPVGHTPDVLTDTTADLAVALLLALLRRIPEAAAYVATGQWGEWQIDLLLGADLHHTTAGIIGMGRIGRAVAQRLAGFDCQILYTGRRRQATEPAGAVFVPPDELLARSDHVIVTASLNLATHHLIDGEALSKMKPTATLVNVARGALVDNLALADALRSGVIAAAALDVTEPEPIPTDHPLLGLPNCLIVPHVGSATRRTRQAMADLATDNLLAGLAGRPMPACVNPEVYGRA
jgi:lactate dehydrogenase-like 2-hydroxyacid dehydrogenase